MDDATGTTGRVLLVDDDESFREVMGFHLAEQGIGIEAAVDGEQALEKFRVRPTPVVVTDLKMPRMSGLELLRELRKLAPDVVVVVITAFGDIETAVDAMRQGAYDFIPKPTQRAHFVLAVERALEHAGLKAQVRNLQNRVDSGRKDLIFQSGAMDRLLNAADRVAESEASVVILGESGTGKELLARRIHRLSNRRDGPFVAVNCAAIPRDLLESELFGHVRGAFTGAVKDRKGKFELAHGGTLFLDEVADMPLDLQPRLLRTLQERTVDVVGGERPVAVDVRVVAATNQDLPAAVAAGAFRSDLYFRLNIVSLEIPPLRRRRDDIAPLMEHFLARYAGDRQFTFAPGLMRRLEAHAWPGNVRELENLCQRLALMAEGERLDESLLPASFGTMEAAGDMGPPADCIALPPEGIGLRELERRIIVRALEINDFNQSRTARFLRIPRHVLLYRMEKYGIDATGSSRGS